MWQCFILAYQVLYSSVWEVFAEHNRISSVYNKRLVSPSKSLVSSSKFYNELVLFIQFGILTSEFLSNPKFHPLVVPYSRKCVTNVSLYRWLYTQTRFIFHNFLVSFFTHLYTFLVQKVYHTTLYIFGSKVVNSML